MSDELSKGIEDGDVQKDLVKSFKNVQEAIDAVQKDNAVGVYKDTYMDQVKPNYLVFYDQENFQKFEKTLTELRKQPGGSNERIQLFDDLKGLAGPNIEPSHLHWIYRSQWAISPKDLISEETDSKIQEEDTQFYQEQREHFSPENVEERHINWQEERALQNQIRVESGSDDDGDFWDDDGDDEDLSHRDNEDSTEELWDKDLSIRDPNPPIELGTSRSKIEKGSDN